MSNVVTIIPEIIELREYKKIDGKARLHPEVEISLNNTIMGFRKYWLNFLENPTSWVWDMGASDPNTIMLGVHTNKKKNSLVYSKDVLERFEKEINKLAKKYLKGLIDHVEAGANDYGMLRFFVDYEPNLDLAIAVKDLENEIENFSFPCKTESYIRISNMGIDNGVLVNADIEAVSSQGHRAPLMYIDIDGKLI